VKAGDNVCIEAGKAGKAESTLGTGVGKNRKQVFGGVPDRLVC
jgi:hypothetical protein